MLLNLQEALGSRQYESLLSVLSNNVEALNDWCCRDILHSIALLTRPRGDPPCPRGVLERILVRLWSRRKSMSRDMHLWSIVAWSVTRLGLDGATVRAVMEELAATVLCKPKAALDEIGKTARPVLGTYLWSIMHMLRSLRNCGAPLYQP